MKTIKEHRLEQGFTQKRMAELMNLGLSTYQQKEQGLINWSLSDLVKIKKILNIVLDDLREVNEHKK